MNRTRSMLVSGLLGLGVIVVSAGRVDAAGNSPWGHDQSGTNMQGTNCDCIAARPELSDPKADTRTVYAGQTRRPPLAANPGRFEVQ
jgi:hypothetical protein